VIGAVIGLFMLFVGLTMRLFFLVIRLFVLGIRILIEAFEPRHGRTRGSAGPIAGLVLLVCIAVGGVVAGVAAISSAFSSSSHGPARTASAVTPASSRLQGRIARDLVSKPPTAVRASLVWCEWRGPNVWVHITLHNRSAHTKSVAISPAYWIAGNGEHGDGESFGVRIAAHHTRTWMHNVGVPQNTPEGTAISACVPMLSSIA
jgi:hypothetical protein